MSILNNIFKFTIIFFYLMINNINAQQIKSEICIPPYFVSLRVSTANSHKGPGMQYKNANKYIQKGTPLLVIAKYDKWRQVTDINNDIGWLLQSQLSSKRYLIVKTEECILFAEPNVNSKQIAILKNKVVMKLKNLHNNWCKVIVIVDKKPKYKGYVHRKNVYGLLDDETNLKL